MVRLLKYVLLLLLPITNVFGNDIENNMSKLIIYQGIHDGIDIKEESGLALVTTKFHLQGSDSISRIDSIFFDKNRRIYKAIFNGERSINYSYEGDSIVKKQYTGSFPFLEDIFHLEKGVIISSERIFDIGDTVSFSVSYTNCSTWLRSVNFIDEASQEDHSFNFYISEQQVVSATMSKYSDSFVLLYDKSSSFLEKIIRGCCGKSIYVYYDNNHMDKKGNIIIRENEYKLKTLDGKMLGRVTISLK